MRDVDDADVVDAAIAGEPTLASDSGLTDTIAASSATSAQEESDESSDDDEGFSIEDAIDEAALLKAAVRRGYKMLACNRGSLEAIWRHVRLSASERLGRLSERMPSFGDAQCEEELHRFTTLLSALAEALAREAGEQVLVTYENGVYEGTVTSVEDALRAEGAEIKVRYEDGGDIAELLSEGEIAPADGARREAAGTGMDGWERAAERLEALAFPPPFHVRKACGAADALGALWELEETLATMEVLLERAVVWAGLHLARALRAILEQARGWMIEARGRLTGVWPTARVEEGQVVEVMPRRGGEALRATVVRILDGPGGREKTAELAVEARGGAGRRRERVGQGEWAERVAPVSGRWPGALKDEALEAATAAGAAVREGAAEGGSRGDGRTGGVKRGHGRGGGSRGAAKRGRRA